MVYCLPIEDYSRKDNFIEELKYEDKNDFEWVIGRLQNGFMVKYLGDDYFKEEIFYCEVSNGESIKIKNTGCLFFNSNDFELFCDIRDIIKIGWTDDIWGTFQELLVMRFEGDRSILECEIIK